MASVVINVIYFCFFKYYLKPLKSLDLMPRLSDLDAAVDGLQTSLLIDDFC